LVQKEEPSFPDLLTTLRRVSLGEKTSTVLSNHSYINIWLAQISDDFVSNWTVAKAWTVDARYTPRTEAEAWKLYSAITDESHGVLKWIRNDW
jgi:hypothetical protein